MAARRPRPRCHWRPLPLPPCPGAAYGAPYNAYPASVLSTESIDPDHKLTRGDRLSYRVVEDRDDVSHPLEVTALR